MTRNEVDAETRVEGKSVYERMETRKIERERNVRAEHKRPPGSGQGIREDGPGGEERVGGEPGN